MWRTLAHAFVFSAPLAAALLLSPFNPVGASVLACLSPTALLLLAAKKSRDTKQVGSRTGLSLAYGLHAYISKIPAALGILTIIRAGWVEPASKR